MIVMGFKELPRWRCAYRGYAYRGYAYRGYETAETPGRISAAPSGMIYGAVARTSPGACHIEVVSPLSTSPS